MKTQKIVIDIKSEFDNDDFIDEIANILEQKKLICNMSYYSGINRTEYMSECDAIEDLTKEQSRKAVNKLFENALIQDIAKKKKQQKKIMDDLNKTISYAING